jgi:N-glycosylase/DNA lyase
MSVDRLVNIEEIENVVMSVSNHIKNKNGNNMSLLDFSEEQLWCSLVSCILGSRVLYETANACAVHLYQKRLLAPSNIVANPGKFEKLLATELSKPIFPPFNENKGRRYVYSKSKSNYIVRTAIEIYKHNDTNLKDILMRCPNEYEARNVLREKAIGIGYKQASLFLRNISYSENLAILDTHVIRYMVLLNMVENDKNLRLSSKNDYIKLENTLYKYAISNDKAISTLDIAIWIVMRLIQREFIIWP